MSDRERGRRRRGPERTDAREERGEEGEGVGAAEPRKDGPSRPRAGAGAGAVGPRGASLVESGRHRALGYDTLPSLGPRVWKSSAAYAPPRTLARERGRAEREPTNKPRRVSGRKEPPR